MNKDDHLFELEIIKQKDEIMFAKKINSFIN